MGFNPLNIMEWAMSEYEVAKFAPVSNDANASSQKLYIPKLMPLISFGAPKITSESLNKSIFLNADECKISVSSTIQSQNYKTVPKPANRKFERILLTQGVTMQVEVKNGNPDQMYISTKVDPSSSDKVSESYEYILEGTGSISETSISVKGKIVEKHS